MSRPSDIFNEREDDYIGFLRTYYKEEIGELHQRWPNEQSSILIDWRDIFQWDPDVAYDLQAHPALFREVFSIALREVDMPSAMDLHETDARDRATVRFANVDEAFSVSKLSGDEVGDLVTVRGQVAKTSAIKPRLRVAYMLCTTCSGHFNVHQPKSGVNKPDVCGIDGCRGHDFRVDFKKSDWVAHQLIRVKEPPEEADGDEYIDVHLTGDAVGGVTAGDRADITGILEADFKDFESPIPEFYLDGHSVSKHESDYEDLDVSDFKEEFKAIANGERGDPYELLIGSVAPSLMGDEKLDTIKLAVGLQLFGGWRRPYGDGRFARGDSHIALIGDPGTGKSSLLDAAESLSPRSAFTSGKNASAAGLTAAAVRDDFGDTEWSLEAGVIVKAHKGVACIDEIDKVDPNAISSLHTALEKQVLEVSKAGIDASLHCQTALLAAGNPNDGRFIDEYHRVEQINLPPALRSRFDLIFTLKDEPNEEHDRKLARHNIDVRTQSGLVHRGDLDESEANHLDPDINANILRAHIAYARQNCFPVIESDTVRDRIEDFYNSMRSSNDEGGVGITARKLDGILRIAEASARVRLSDTIELEDVERATNIIETSLKDVGVDPETGEFEADYMETGVSGSQRERVRTIEGIIETLEPGDGSGVPIDDVVSNASSTHSESKVRKQIDDLADNGRLYKPSHNRVKTT